MLRNFMVFYESIIRQVDLTIAFGTAVPDMAYVPEQWDQAGPMNRNESGGAEPALADAPRTRSSFSCAFQH